MLKKTTDLTRTMPSFFNKNSVQRDPGAVRSQAPFEKASISEKPAETKTSWFGRKTERLNVLLKQYSRKAKAYGPVSEVPLHKRTTFILISMSNKLKAVLAKKTITLFTRIDDLLVQGKNVAHKKDEAQQPFPSNSQQPSSEARETVLGPLIAENTESRIGINWPQGLPPEELALYTNPKLIVVEGGATNRYGHALIAFGDPAGEARYVQISSANWYPEHMTEVQFQEYCQRWECEISQEISLPCTDKQALQQGVDRLSRKKWLWGGPYHNCLSFVNELASSGGVDMQELGQFRRVSNELPGRAMSAFSKAIYLSTDGIVPNSQREDVIQELKQGLSQALDINTHNPGNTQEWLAHVTQDLLSQIPHLPLTTDAANRLQEKLGQNLQECIWELIEQSDFDFLVDYLKSDTDIPVHSARNMPVGLRTVGPQSRRGFDNEEGL
ncbi:hypothetical protein [Parendozoicomonas haliclonae]|uniref:Uncharacterized protein n=1 Tax=Parendozoicomonas haliclonae TaxID=1960125 RepID=A0A1X7APC9_9GAMM|nr:hypothetical protein [Parendozoicomonas haliclonae]SMA50003.1 hypothetical protein EHSB41UT_03794 [Parendozoicomonas haliclonae]